VYASAIAVQGTNAAEAYARFRAAVAQAQLTHWLTGLGTATARATLVDISGPGTNAAELAADRGHAVLRVVPPGVSPTTAPGIPPKIPVKTPAKTSSRTPPEDAAPEGRVPENTVGDTVEDAAEGPRCRRRAGIRLVSGDSSSLEFLADGSADGVIAEDGTLSVNLAAETLVTEIARVLRPGGKVFACVTSLTFGMAALAQQSRWPHLIDLPRADVVLVPWPDGTITRCYGAEQLRELFTANGFEVNWVRPRTVFAPRAVSYLLARDPRSFPRLLNAELRSRSDDSVGDHLIVSAKKR
jgi:SAM-dependent methyltransferase